MIRAGRGGRRGSPAAVLSHVAVWPSAYLLGAVVCVSQTTGMDRQAGALTRLGAAGFTVSAAAAVYLLDRVKVRDAWLDPADEAAHAGRQAFIAGNSRAIRAAVVVLVGIAAWLGTWIVAAGWIIPLLAVTGVLVYAGRPRADRARPKDVLLLKNMYVGAGIAGFAGMVSIAAAHPGGSMAGMLQTARAHAGAVMISCVLLAARVVADAILCDIDDSEADRRHRTATLPNRIGRRRAWDVALCMRLAIAGALAASVALPLWPRVLWAGVTAGTSITLRAAAPARLRDLVDARLAIEAGIVTAILTIMRG